MIKIEDSNAECYHINPMQVVYVKERLCPSSEDQMWKILLSTGEVIMTKNVKGAQTIIESIKQRYS
jgi:hypothetical protein